jgi:hypothetical protein
MSDQTALLLFLFGVITSVVAIVAGLVGWILLDAVL